MKYIIINNSFCVLGEQDNSYHAWLKEGFGGRVTGAGYMKIKEGKVEVYSGSVGFNMESKPEDAKIIANDLGLKYE